MNIRYKITAANQRRELERLRLKRDLLWAEISVRWTLISESREYQALSEAISTDFLEKYIKLHVKSESLELKIEELEEKEKMKSDQDKGLPSPKKVPKMPPVKRPRIVT